MNEKIVAGRIFVVTGGTQGLGREIASHSAACLGRATWRIWQPTC